MAVAWPITSQGDTLFEAIQNQTGYYGINAPSTLQHRYISEDVPMSLVPIAALERAVRRLGQRDQRHDPVGVYFAQHGLLAEGAHAGQAGDQGPECDRVDPLCE